MNLAKHMEAVFVAATLLLCAVTYQSDNVGVTDPGPASIVQAQQIAHQHPEA